MMKRVYNFSAGPAVLPQEVLEEAQEHLLSYKDSGMSILESSHRGKEYSAIHEEGIANITQLLDVPDDYAVLFLQGGATTQFSMVPMNLLGDRRVADYTNSGAWASKAIHGAQSIGRVNVCADTSKDRPARVPEISELNLTPQATYLHITSNETISGAQWKYFPEPSVPLVADMSSDILSKPIDVTSFGLIYAGAQKNLGPAGVTLVIIRKDLARRVGDEVPEIFRYKTHIDNNSLYNTPPCFSIYLVTLVTRWLLKQGGLEEVQKRNEDKALRLYRAIDKSSFFEGTALKDYRSDMNVTFNLSTEDLEQTFVQEASQHDLKGLKGHRSVGGVRASIYNAFPLEGVETLTHFMKEFEAT
ncbi:MAG: 3-phosphoserine/phosphohydroxythreonine transaminase [Kiritimatiellae bacterium]|nr:3-phosphoserine/phosphohydroxythreonine transaminase [Kiritimatiellia bacterium]